MEDIEYNHNDMKDMEGNHNLIEDKVQSQSYLTLTLQSFFLAHLFDSFTSTFISSNSLPFTLILYFILLLPIYSSLSLLLLPSYYILFIYALYSSTISCSLFIHNICVFPCCKSGRTTSSRHDGPSQSVSLQD